MPIICKLMYIGVYIDRLRPSVACIFQDSGLTSVNSEDGKMLQFRQNLTFLWSKMKCMDTKCIFIIESSYKEKLQKKSQLSRFFAFSQKLPTLSNLGTNITDRDIQVKARRYTIKIKHHISVIFIIIWVEIEIAIPWTLL